MKKLALIFMMVLIFKLSSTSGLKVADPSTWLNQTIYIKEWSLSFLLDIKSDFYKPYQDILSLNFILHKISHIIFYSILAILIYINVNNRLWITLISLFGYAFSDEIHQHFVVGRSGRMWDVCLDFAAGTVCLFLFILILKKININTVKP